MRDIEKRPQLRANGWKIVASVKSRAVPARPPSAGETDNLRPLHCASQSREVSSESEESSGLARGPADLTQDTLRARISAHNTSSAAKILIDGLPLLLPFLQLPSQPAPRLLLVPREDVSPHQQQAPEYHGQSERSEESQSTC